MSFMHLQNCPSKSAKVTSEERGKKKADGIREIHFTGGKAITIL